MNRKLVFGLIAAFCFFITSTPSQAALLINFDLEGFQVGIEDDYTTGPAVFGDASSQWNIADRLVSQSNLALFDDTGAATGVTVSYTRASSGIIGFPMGTFADLGTSTVGTSGDVAIDGLTPGASYDLAVMAVNVSGSSVLNWSVLTEGRHYVLFDDLVADGSGNIDFQPPGDFSGSPAFSSFQLRASTGVIPEPSTIAIWSLLGLAGLGYGWRKKRKAA